MDNFHSYKSFEKTFNLIEKIKKLELEYHIGEIRGLLYLIAKHVQEKTGIPKIEELTSVIDLYCKKHGNEPTWCRYDIKLDFYNKYKQIGCISNRQYMPYKVECIDYSNISLIDLSDSPQIISSLEGIKYSILSTYNILNPGVLIDIGKQYMNIITYISMDLNNPIKENSEISKNNNIFRYRVGKFNIEMAWYFYDPPKL